MRKILAIYDVPGWAYHRRAVALQKYAPSDMAIDLADTVNCDWEQICTYDLIFLLDYSVTAKVRARLRQYDASLPLVVSFNMAAGCREHKWREVIATADYVIVNNRGRWESNADRTKTCCIANGVDLDVFHATTPIGERSNRCVWLGSARQGTLKGYDAIIRPLKSRLAKRGFDCHFKCINEVSSALGEGELTKLYNSSSYILCTSSSEGTPNPILEGMACGCVAVSTLVGNVAEFGRDRFNCVIAKRSVESFVDGLEYARMHRSRISHAGRKTMEQWHYGPPGNRAQYFYQLWRKVIDNGPGSIQPFCYSEKHWTEIC